MEKVTLSRAQVEALIIIFILSLPCFFISIGARRISFECWGLLLLFYSVVVATPNVNFDGEGFTILVAVGLIGFIQSFLYKAAQGAKPKYHIESLPSFLFIATAIIIKLLFPIYEQSRDKDKSK